MKRALSASVFAIGLGLACSGCLLGFDDPSCDPSAHPTTCTDGAVCDPIQKICVRPGGSGTTASSTTGTTTSSTSSTGTATTSGSGSASSGTSSTTVSSSTTSSGSTSGSGSSGTSSTATTSSSSSGTSGTTSTTSSSTTGSSGASFVGQLALGDATIGPAPGGALVGLANLDGGLLRRPDGGPYDGIADDAGNFSIDGIPFGSYTVIAGKSVSTAFGSVVYGTALSQVSFSAFAPAVTQMLGHTYASSIPTPLVLPATAERAAVAPLNCLSSIEAQPSGEAYFVDGTDLVHLPAAGSAATLVSNVSAGYTISGGLLATLTDAGPGRCAYRVMVLDGGAELAEGDAGCTSGAPVLSPDGKLLGFWSACNFGTPESCDFNLVPLEGGYPARAVGTTPVSAGAGSSSFSPWVAFTPDSRMMAFVAGPASTFNALNGTLTLAMLDGGPGHPTHAAYPSVIAVSENGYEAPQFSPDFQHLAFMSTGNFPFCHVLSPTDAWAALETGTDAGAYDLGSCFWYGFSPDSSLLAVVDQFNYTLEVMPASGGPRTRVAASLSRIAPNSTFGFTGDGRGLFFIDSSGLERWDFDAGAYPDAGVVAQLLAPSADSYQLSPDGQTLAVWINQGAGTPDSLELVPASGGAPVAVTDPNFQTQPVSGVVFSQNSAWLAFVEAPTGPGTQSGPLYVAATSPDGGGAVQVGQNVYSASPGAETYAFTRNGATLAFIDTLAVPVLEGVATSGGAPVPLTDDARAPIWVTNSGVTVNRCNSSSTTPYLNGLYEIPLP